MKQICYIILLILILPTYFHAVSFEASVNTFFPTNEIMKNMYGEAWPDFALIVDHIQPFDSVPQLSFFGQVDYLFKDGFSLNFHQATTIQLIPITLGIKWIQPIRDDVEIYFGVAPKYYFMHMTNDSTFIPPASSQNGCGFFANLGGFIYPTEHFMIDIFCSYSYMNFAAPESVPGVTSFSTNVSGFNLGVGLGYDF